VIGLKSKPCIDCGFPAPDDINRAGGFPYWVMDFDHIPGNKKRGDISSMARDPQFSKQQVLNEIARCEVVCSRCHRDRTFRRKYDPGYLGRNRES
jgi:hypothetical protein